MLKILAQILLFFFPWRLRRLLLCSFFNFDIAKTAKIGYSILLANKVILKDYSSIGHLNICKKIDLLELGEYSNIGTRNFITGFSTQIIGFKHFTHISNRECVLRVGKHTGITSRHYFDCNGGIYIGDFCQIAGFESAFLTHSIDLKLNRQDTASIVINNYVFIGTRCTFLKGSSIPSRSLVSACSLINKKFTQEDSLYGGVPCKFIKNVKGYHFFNRKVGFVV